MCRAVRGWVCSCMWEVALLICFWFGSSNLFFSVITQAGSGILGIITINAIDYWINKIAECQSSARSVPAGSPSSRNPPHNSVQQSEAGSTTRKQHTTSNTKYALPVDRQTTQTEAAQAGTIATACFSHLCCSNESGRKVVTPRYNTVKNATICFRAYHTITFARRSSIGKKRRAKRADFCACIELLTIVIS